MCQSKALGTILNPIGAIAPDSGAGQLLDPVKAIGKQVGGANQDLIDPAGSLREGGYQQQRNQAKVEANAAQRRKDLGYDREFNIEDY